MTREMPVRIVASGDVVPLRPLPPDHSLSPAVLAAFEHLRAADVAVGSLEAPLTDVGEPWEKIVCYRAHPCRARDVAAMGFDLVSLANNQTMNYGVPGLVQTIEALAAEGVRHVGAGSSLEEAWAPVVIEVPRTTSCACRVHLRRAPRMGRHRGSRWARGAASANGLRGRQPVVGAGGAWRSAQGAHVARCRRARPGRDGGGLGVMPGGCRRRARPLGVGATANRADYQRQLAEALVGAGAGLILGGHPPPLQGVDVIGRSLVCYSQGTFVRQQPRPPELAAVYEAMPKTGALLLADLARGGARRIELLPTRLGDDDLSGLLGAREAGRQWWLTSRRDRRPPPQRSRRRATDPCSSPSFRIRHLISK